MQLSRHLDLDEFIHSDTANEHKIDNTLPKELLPNAVFTANFLFEPIRSLLGDHPITIDSGYRCKELNELVRGVPSSQHCLGQAFDFIPSNMSLEEAFKKIEHSNMTFDQLIMEHSKASGARWIHVSIRSDGKNRHQIIPYLEKK